MQFRTFDSGNIPILAKLDKLTSSNTLIQESERLLSSAYQSFKNEKEHLSDKKLENFFGNFNNHIKILVNENKELKSMIKDLCAFQIQNNGKKDKGEIYSSKEEFDNKKVKLRSKKTSSISNYDTFSKEISNGETLNISHQGESIDLDNHKIHRNEFLSVKIKELNGYHREEISLLKAKYEGLIKEQDSIIREFQVKHSYNFLGKVQRV